MEITIFRGTPDCHIDERREIDDTFLGEEIKLPFPVRQFKTIIFTPQAVVAGMAVGNHYHPEKTNRQEFFVFQGQLSEKEKKNPPVAALFRFRKAGEQEIEESKLKVGDACLVPAGYAHAFVPVREGVYMVGISNKPFDKGDDVTDKLF